MKKTAKLLALALITSALVLAQAQSTHQMEKRITNPWQWQDQRSYVQAVEVKNVTSTLYVSGQTAISADGVSSNEDMESQLIQAIQNLEKVIVDAGFENKGLSG